MIKNCRLIVLLIILGHGSISMGQVQDSVRSRKLLYRSIVPTTSIVASIFINGSQFEHNVQESLMGWVGEDFHSNIDEYFRFVPIAEMYLADIVGVQSKNHWFDQTKYLFISNLISSTITYGLKSWTGKTRPNGEPNSSPSGHTTVAFTNATVLFNEFNETAPLLAYSGYAFAATAGFYRMLNNEHWLSDILLAAGIGMLVTELVYYFEPFKAFNPFKKSSSISFLPKVSAKEYGFYFSYRIR